MSNQLKGFVLQADQGLIHKDTSIFSVVFTSRISEAYLFNSVWEIDVFKTLRGLNSMPLTCYQIHQQT
jgi:hypothetical protein